MDSRLDQFAQITKIKVERRRRIRRSFAKTWIVLLKETSRVEKSKDEVRELD